MRTYTKEDDENFNRYLQNMKGFWFAATLPEMEDWAADKVQEGILKPLAEMVPNKKMARGWYVPADSKIQDLTKFFTHWAINQFGIFDLNLDFQI